MDSASGGVRYPAQLLAEWKKSHEQRVEIVTGISNTRQSQVVLYGANVGEHSSPLRYEAAALAMHPERFPSNGDAISLGMNNSRLRDRDEDYWHVEERQLRRSYQERVAAPLADGKIQHLSIFALAPQPLLILLGALITDIPGADVHQLKREPAGWGWVKKGPRDLGLEVEEPADAGGPPALVIGISATIAPERVQRIDPKFRLWHLRVPKPHNDILRSRGQLKEFRETVRSLLNRIKERHGPSAVVSIFPAMPVATAVELGRVRMPKADLPWRLFDEIPAKGGFVHALDISGAHGASA
jgi:hypothetical protein